MQYCCLQKQVNSFRSILKFYQLILVAGQATSHPGKGRNVKSLFDTEILAITDLSRFPQR